MSPPSYKNNRFIKEALPRLIRFIKETILMGEGKNKKCKDEHCFTETHKTDLQISQYTDEPEVTYFLDETNNHNKTLVTVKNNDTDCYFILTINGKTYPGIPPGRSFAVQKEDVRSIKIKVTMLDPDLPPDMPMIVFTSPTPEPSPTPGTDDCRGTLTIEKTFCICCCTEND